MSESSEGFHCSLTIMRCPACRHPALEHDQACSQCGFSLEALAQQMGIPPMLNAPVADLVNALSARERRSSLRTIQALHQRFPQLSFAAVLTDLAPEMPLAVHAFWLFNKGSLFSAVERGGDNHGVLFLHDTIHDQTAVMLGYGLEPFVSEVTLEVCLAAASASLAKGQYGVAIEAFVRELERQLTTLLAQLPSTFGYSENGHWQGSGEESVPDGMLAHFEAEDLY